MSRRQPVLAGLRVQDSFHTDLAVDPVAGYPQVRRVHEARGVGEDLFGLAAVLRRHCRHGAGMTTACSWLMSPHAAASGSGPPSRSRRATATCPLATEGDRCSDPRSHDLVDSTCSAAAPPRASKDRGAATTRRPPGCAVVGAREGRPRARDPNGPRARSRTTARTPRPHRATRSQLSLACFISTAGHRQEARAKTLCGQQLRAERLCTTRGQTCAGCEATASPNLWCRTKSAQPFSHGRRGCHAVSGGAVSQITPSGGTVIEALNG